MTGYLALRKAGPLHNGAERGKGSIYHAVPHADGRKDWMTATDGNKALCGQQPALQWSTHPGDAVTCPRCLRKMEAPL